MQAAAKIGSRVGHARKQILVFHDIEKLQAEPAGQRAATQCAAMLAQAKRVKHVGVDQQGAERQTAAEWLAQ